jgi:hypothetical protein
MVLLRPADNNRGALGQTSALRLGEAPPALLCSELTSKSFRIPETKAHVSSWSSTHSTRFFAGIVAEAVSDSGWFNTAGEAQKVK